MSTVLESPAIATSVVHDLPIAWNCLFYEGGPGSDPSAAIVTKSNGRGILNLEVCSPSGGRFRRQSVIHVSSPDIQLRPLVVQRCGCWDYVPGFPRPSQAVEKPAENKPGNSPASNPASNSGDKPKGK